MSLSFIHHNGKKVLYIDYSNCKTPQETVAVLEQVRNEYLRTNEHYLTLNNFTNAVSNNEYMDLVKKYGKEVFDARTVRNAGLGLTGIKKILLSAYNITVKNKLIPFDSKEEALEFLTKN